MPTLYKDLAPPEHLTNLCASFSSLFNVAVAIVELDGKILFSAGWKKACSEFHRQHPLTSARCLESDTSLASQVMENKGYAVYHCKNGLVDVAVPIIVNDKHVTNLFAGQFLFEKADSNVFAKQAAEANFNEKEYLKAIGDIPVFTQERVKEMVLFLQQIAETIGELGYKNLLLKNANKELDAKQFSLQKALYRASDSETRLRTILDNIDACIYLKDESGKYLYINRELSILLCPDLKDHSNPAMSDDCSDAFLDPLNSTDAHVLSGYKISGQEIELAERSYLITKVPVKHPDGSIYAICGVLMDITSIKNSEKEIIKSHKLLDTVINNIPVMVLLESNNKKNCELINSPTEEFLGIAQEKLNQDNYHTHCDPFRLKAIKGDPEQYHLNHPDWSEHEVLLEDEKKTYFTKRIPIEDDLGNCEFTLYVSEDISERKKSEELIKYQASYDELTGLPNRRQLDECLQQAIEDAKKNNHQLAYLFIDLDHFKDINDTSGHDIGDAVIFETARRIKSCIREQDLIARYGGDEVIVVVKCQSSLSDADRISDQITRVLSKPFNIVQEKFFLTASIGISVFPEHAESPIGLLKCADQAMYSAKKSNRGSYAYFDSSMQVQVQNRISLAKDMHDALSKNQFELYYQPIVDIKQHNIVKAEALLRWHHPVHGFISPEIFIPIAEATGLIHEIGEWVFKTALKNSKELSQKLGYPFQISVNKSPVQYRQKEADKNWLKQLKDENLSGENLCIEITEGVLLQKDEEVSDSLNMYRDLGIEVSLDDFGTGYSSLSYLNRFDIDYLKIDKSFIDNLHPDTPNYALCEAIVVMADKLGVKVIAEGVETEEQLQYISGIGCNYIQGYVFSRPLPSLEFEDFVISFETNASSNRR
ncbi:MAG: EAL domain-containing protein [Neptuniibacter sp.]